MKIRLAIATVAAAFMFAGAPATAEAGGLHKLCPLSWVHHHHHHHGKVVKAKKVKKVVYKKVAKKAVYKKPAKKVVYKKAAKKVVYKKPLK